MGTMSLLAWAALFAAIFLLTFGILKSFEKIQSLRKRVKGAKTEYQAILRVQKGSPLKERLLSWLSSYGSWALKHEEEISKVQLLLTQAGLRHPLAPTVYYGTRAAVALLLPIPVILFILVKGKVSTGTVTLAFMVSGIGYFLPQILLEKVAQARQERIDKALPDVLDLFVICLEAGLGLQATINRVAQEIQAVCKDFHTELQLTAGEMRVGINRDQALKNLAQRTGVQSVRALSTLIIQSDKLGTSISQALRVHADTSRVQRSLKAEEQAGKMPVKILMPLIFCIFPTVFVVAVGPGIIQIVRQLLPGLRGQ
jgi:tight adherence protein C